MARFNIMFQCDECGELHPRPEKEIESPGDLLTMVGEQAFCPITGKMTTQEDNNKIVFVPEQKPEQTWIDMLREDNPQLSEDDLKAIARET